MSRIQIHTAGVNQSIQWKGVWSVGVHYTINHQVGNGGNFFLCRVAHTSSATDEPGVGANWENYWIRQDTVQPSESYEVDGGTI
jgi:hypothetical protein